MAKSKPPAGPHAEQIKKLALRPPRGQRGTGYFYQNNKK